MKNIFVEAVIFAAMLVLAALAMNWEKVVDILAH